MLVPTPLGNLGDITRRALEALRDADVIVAEDTRVARKLLNALAIGPKELWSYREQNAAADYRRRFSVFADGRDRRSGTAAGQ